MIEIDFDKKKEGKTNDTKMYCLTEKENYVYSVDQIIFSFCQGCLSLALLKENTSSSRKRLFSNFSISFLGFVKAMLPIMIFKKTICIILLFATLKRILRFSLDHSSQIIFEKTMYVLIQHALLKKFLYNK